jgi:hypothetical protein
MKKSILIFRNSLRYNLLVYRLDQFWLPGGLWILFVIIFFFFGKEQYSFAISGGYFGILIPLIAGILASSAVLGDPALELQFVSPRPTWTILFERLGLILGSTAGTAFAFEGFMVLVGMDRTGFGNFWSLQLDWLIPSLALMSFSTVIGLAFRQASTGALFTGGLWLIQVLLRDWFMADRVGRYFFLFTGVRNPTSPYLAANWACLAGITILFFYISAIQLKKTEHYL